MRRILSLVALALLPGCATIVTGSTHNMAVASEPAGATCRVERHGQAIGFVTTTPGSVAFSKSSQALDLTCTNAAQGTVGNTAVPSGLEPWFFGNLLIGGIVGIVVDIASGAVSSYPESATVVMGPGAVAPKPAANPPAVLEPEGTGRPVS